MRVGRLFGTQQLKRAFIFALWANSLSAVAQDTALVGVMVRNEVSARAQESRYSYSELERSARTDGHLWSENVVETDDGPLRRLLAVDGKALSTQDTTKESERIAAILRNPTLFRTENATHRGDEVRATALLALLPKAFLISPAGSDGSCQRFLFRPNPAFEPSSYEERVIHAMGGSLTVNTAAGRLCTLQSKVLTPVEFAHGLLGSVDAGGGFSLERVPVTKDHWKSARISVHIKGHILLLKTLTRDQEVERSNIQLLPFHPTLEQAAKMTRP